MEVLTKPGTELRKRYPPDHKLKKEETENEANALYPQLTEFLDNDPDVLTAEREDPPDPIWPDKTTWFKKNGISYRENRQILSDKSVSETGRQVRIIRYDNFKNEEDLTVRVGQHPAVEYRFTYAGGIDKPPVMSPNPEQMPPFYRINARRKHSRPLTQTGYLVDRNYTNGTGLSINYAWEMIDRMEKDFK
jgi:hypothetical protein